MKLKCQCKNDTDFEEETTVNFTVDAEGNREKKLDEHTSYYCKKCGRHIFMGD